MKKVFTLAYLISSLLLIAPTGYAQDSNQNLSFNRTVRFIEKQQKKRGIPGLAYAITRGNEIVRSGGLGVKSTVTNEPVDESTLFHIGSTHKSITAFMLARLIESGNLAWSSTVQQLSPLVQYDDRVVERIQLQQLMNMTSGILDFSEDDFYDAYGENATPQQLIQFMQSYRTPAFPGDEWSYSNLSVSLAGYLSVHAIGGNTADLNRGYSDLLQQLVLEPLGMESSTIYLSEARTSGNFSYSHNRQGGVAATYDRDDDMFAPAGSLKSNVIDMSHYLITLAQRGVAPSGERVISKSGLKKLWRPSALSKSSGDNYGLGWDIKRLSGVKIMMHEGAYDNFTSVIAVSPRHKAGLVILVNTESVGKLLSRAPELFASELKKKRK